MCYLPPRFTPSCAYIKQAPGDLIQPAICAHLVFSLLSLQPSRALKTTGQSTIIHRGFREKIQQWGFCWGQLLFKSRLYPSFCQQFYLVGNVIPVQAFLFYPFLYFRLVPAFSDLTVTALLCFPQVPQRLNGPIQSLNLQKFLPCH